MTTATADCAELPDEQLLAALAHPADPLRDVRVEQLVRRHAPWMHAYASRHVPTSQDADDAVQTVLILLVRKAPRMNTRVRLTGWLFEALRFTLRDIRRSHRRRRFHERRAARPLPPTPQAPFATSDTLRALDAALVTLSRADRLVILLRYHRNLPVKAVAGALCATEGAARKRLARAIHRLRKQLGAAPPAPLGLLAKAASHAPCSAAWLHTTAAPALAVLHGSAVPAPLLPLLHAAEKTMTLTRLALLGGGLALAAAGLLLAAGGHSHPPAVHSESLAATAPASLAVNEVRPISIVRPDGRPAANATVFVLTADDAVQILNGRVHPSLINAVTSASATAGGILTLRTSDPAEELLIYEDAGYARILHTTAEAAGIITLTPWGRIEGTARRGTKSAPGITISTFYPDEIHRVPYTGRYFAYNNVKADADGHFILDRVFAGRVQVSAVNLEPTDDGGSVEISIGTDFVTVAPGGSANVALGGHGRPISGSITLPAELLHTAHSRASVHLQRNPARQAATQPAKPGEFDPQTFSLFVQEDGTFRAENVPAGTYTLVATIQALRPAPPDEAMHRETIAAANKEVTLPPIPGGVSDECLNIGSLDLRSIPPK